MANIIEFKLCQEDRERLDKIIDLLAAAGTPYPAAGTDTVLPGQDDEPAKGEPKADEPALTPTPEEPQAEEPALKPTPEEPKAEPSVTLEEIQQKVVKLCAVNSQAADPEEEEKRARARKAKVRAIINEYGAKVSDLKDKPEKWDEVHKRLCVVESEG